MDNNSNKAGSSVTEEVSQAADESAVTPFLVGDSTPSSTSSSATAVVTQDANAAATRPLSATGTSSPEAILNGTGVSYRHDWGRRHGQQRLNLNWGIVNARSRVLVAISEGAAGGPDNGKFIGAARFTVHNVAPRNGGVDVWVNIEWGADIPLYVDYLVVNP